jgi:hypothetical protein
MRYAARVNHSDRFELNVLEVLQAQVLGDGFIEAAAAQLPQTGLLRTIVHKIVCGGGLTTGFTGDELHSDEHALAGCRL